MLKCIRSNIKQVYRIYVLKPNNEYKLFNNPTIYEIDEMIKNNYKILSFVFKSRRSWIHGHILYELQNCNQNNELQFFDAIYDSKYPEFIFNFIN